MSSIRHPALALFVGLLFGFFGSMPIAGPTAVVLVSKGLENKVRSGLAIALGASAAESVYVFMAFWGLTSALNRFPVLVPASRLVGSLILLGLGFTFALRKTSPPSLEDHPTPDRVGIKNLLFGASLTAVNPTLLVTWTAAVSAAHSTGLLRVWAMDAFPFAGGAALGMVSWSALLLWLLSHFRRAIRPETMHRLIRAMGVLLIVVGAALTFRVVHAIVSAS